VGLEQDRETASVHLRREGLEGQTITARYVVAADGGAAFYASL